MGTKLNKNQRKSKVLKIANKALDNKNDLKIIVPEIKNKKKAKKDGTIKRKKEHKEKHYFVKLEMDQQQIKRYIEGIGRIGRVLTPHPPKFEIFTIEANRIKIKVWDQNSSNNKIGKKEKTEFIARIAEQVPIRNNVSSSEENDDEMPDNLNIVEVEEGNLNDDNNKNDDILLVEDDEKKEENDKEENILNGDEEEHDEQELDENVDDDINEEYKYNDVQKKEKVKISRRKKKRTSTPTKKKKKKKKKKK